MHQVGAGLCLAVGGADIRVASASARFLGLPSSYYVQHFVVDAALQDGSDFH